MTPFFGSHFSSSSNTDILLLLLSKGDAFMLASGLNITQTDDLGSSQNMDFSPTEQEEEKMTRTYTKYTTFNTSIHTIHKKESKIQEIDYITTSEETSSDMQDSGDGDIYSCAHAAGKSTQTFFTFHVTYSIPFIFSLQLSLQSRRSKLPQRSPCPMASAAR